MRFKTGSFLKFPGMKVTLHEFSFYGRFDNSGVSNSGVSLVAAQQGRILVHHEPDPPRRRAFPHRLVRLLTPQVRTYLKIALAG